MAERKGVAKVLQDVIATAKIELHKCKKLNKAQKDKFRLAYGMSSIDGDIYYNFTNIVLTSQMDYKSLEYYINSEDLVLKIENFEYNTFVYVFSFLNNDLLRQAIGIR